MALKVLLADDSVPAQNMGKKILTDAGYDVLTVSNGLEALRKIADTMPDIAILDIFMPGYTGLEICERLRASAATAELPVILTVGKLEPYRPEDGEHVRSNAVIVKPFAAAELTAAVRSLIGVRRAEVVFSADNPPPAQVAAPLQEETAPATGEMPPLSPALAETPAASDDALFFPSESATAGAEFTHSDEEASGPESLVFNPDAKHTAFSASAIEASPTELNIPAEAGPSAFTEFDLRFDAPPYAFAEPSPAAQAVESWHAEPEAGAQDAMEQDAAADGMTMAAPEPLATAAEPAIGTDGELAESVEAAVPVDAGGASVAAAEPESFPLEVLAIEPWVEEPEGVAPCDGLTSDVVATGATEPSVEAGEVPETIILEDGVADGEVYPDETYVALSPEEEARRQAFEDLFNSDVPFPLEEDPLPIPVPASVTPPSLTESSKQELCDFELEPEIVMDDHTDGDHHGPMDALVAPSASPEAVEGFEPASAVDPIFDDEPVLEENPFSSSPSYEIEQPPVEADSSVLGDSYTVRPDVLSPPMPQLRSEASPKVLEMPLAAAPVEVAPVEVTPVEAAFPAPVASPERSELVAEVAKVEALLVQMQAVRQVDEPAGPAHTGTEFRQSEAEPYLQSLGGAAQAESAPVQANGEAQMEAAAAPAQIETELPEAEAAPMRHEPEVEPELVSSPLETTPEELAHCRSEASEDESSFAPAPENGLIEAERIHKAVELVFDRFRPLLVAAIVRELVRRD